MEINDMIEAKRWHKQYDRTIRVSKADEDEEIGDEYDSLVDRIAEDYGMEGDYALEYIDGSPMMIMNVNDCSKPCDKYDAEMDGDWIYINLNGVVKDGGCMGAGTAGAVNARYSDKPKKSKVAKSYVIVYYNEWGREDALLSKYHDYVVDFMDYTQPLDDVEVFDDESEAQKVANKVKRKFPAGDYRVVDVDDLSEPLKDLLHKEGVLKSEVKKSSRITDKDFTGQCWGIRDYDTDVLCDEHGLLIFADYNEAHEVLSSGRIPNAHDVGVVLIY